DAAPDHERPRHRGRRARAARRIELPRLPNEAPLARGFVDRLAARRPETGGWLVPHPPPQELPRADGAAVAQPDQLLLTCAGPAPRLIDALARRERGRCGRESSASRSSGTGKGSGTASPTSPGPSTWGQTNGENPHPVEASRRRRDIGSSGLTARPPRRNR